MVRTPWTIFHSDDHSEIYVTDVRTKRAADLARKMTLSSVRRAESAPGDLHQFKPYQVQARSDDASCIRYGPGLVPAAHYGHISDGVTLGCPLQNFKAIYHNNTVLMTGSRLLTPNSVKRGRIAERAT